MCMGIICMSKYRIIINVIGIPKTSIRRSNAEDKGRFWQRSAIKVCSYVELVIIDQELDIVQGGDRIISTGTWSGHDLTNIILHNNQALRRPSSFASEPIASVMRILLIFWI